MSRRTTSKTTCKIIFKSIFIIVTAKSDNVAFSKVLQKLF